ncbi:MAG: hypothetical protein K8S16_15275, partial [Bacteroidales bacterium]|nr:hypothetical protein [Bacteroidales bacterium]
MLPKKVRIFFYCLILILAIHTVYSQQLNAQEGEIITRAEKLFEAKNYQEAMPLFAQLVSVHPENGEYNYKFGVCTLYGNRSDHRRPIRYLNNALKSLGDNPELHYHLGIAYYQNQEFANAMKFLNLYLAKLDPNSPKRPQILERVNCCLNGLTLEHANLIGEIFSASEFQKDNFHRAYRADEFNGTLIIKPDIFVTPNERKRNENSFVFVSEPRGTLYFSGYDGNTADHRDIFKVEMTEDGDWGKPSKVSETINTNFDEAYPVLTDYGTTLYFCSKGHNSIGGFDIFRSKLDTATQTFSKPENLGVGINSPFNDILFIPGKTGSNAFFASDRDNLNESINVFRIQLIDNAFGTDQVLANNNFESKLNISRTGNTSENAIHNKARVNDKTEVKNLASSEMEPETPSEKAANLVKLRTIANNMGDTAYMKVAETKSLVRNLTNKRDRANAISQRKQEAAKNLEISFDGLVENLANITGEVNFEKELQKAIELKNEIFQFRFRAKKANLIAWSIGKQIKIKNTELEELKKKAGEVQSSSVRGNFDKTESSYTRLITDFNIADTLTDYNEFIVLIAKDELNADIPGTELAFADEYRTAFNNNTLIATTQKPKPAIEAIPINVIDNRAKTIAKNTIDPVKLVESVSFSENLALILADNEELSINFTVDAIEPITLVKEVMFADNSFDEPIDENLELNFIVDRANLVKMVNPVTYYDIAYNIDITDEELEIKFTNDHIRPFELVAPVTFDDLAYLAEIDEEELEINSYNDKIIALKLTNTVEFSELAANIEIDENDLEINFNIDGITATTMVEEIAYS